MPLRKVLNDVLEFVVNEIVQVHRREWAVLLISGEDPAYYRFWDPGKVNQFSVAFPVTKADEVGELRGIKCRQRGDLLFAHLLLCLAIHDSIIASKNVRDTIRTVTTDDVFLEILNRVVVRDPAVTDWIILLHEVELVKLDEVLVSRQDQSGFPISRRALLMQMDAMTSSASAP